MSVSVSACPSSRINEEVERSKARHSQSFGTYATQKFLKLMDTIESKRSSACARARIKFAKDPQFNYFWRSQRSRGVSSAPSSTKLSISY